MSEILENAFISILRFCKDNYIWGLPTNPISGLLYVCMAYYGYLKLKPRIKARKYFSKILAFSYAICILGFINFTMENVWLTFFYLRFHYFNNGWQTISYLNEPWGWLINFYRNFALMLIFWYISREAWKHIRFNYRTLIGMLTLSFFLFLDFFATPSYAYIDWAYGITYNFSNSIIIMGFLVALIGKPILFYIYYSVWRDEK